MTVYMCVCVCMCVCGWVGARVRHNLITFEEIFMHVRGNHRSTDTYDLAHVCECVCAPSSYNILKRHYSTTVA